MKKSKKKINFALFGVIGLCGLMCFSASKTNKETALEKAFESCERMEKNADGGYSFAIENIIPLSQRNYQRGDYEPLKGIYVSATDNIKITSMFNVDTKKRELTLQHFIVDYSAYMIMNSIDDATYTGLPYEFTFKWSRMFVSTQVIEIEQNITPYLDFNYYIGQGGADLTPNEDLDLPLEYELSIYMPDEELGEREIFYRDEIVILDGNGYSLFNDEDVFYNIRNIRPLNDYCINPYPFGGASISNYTYMRFRGIDFTSNDLLRWILTLLQDNGTSEISYNKGYVDGYEDGQKAGYNYGYGVGFEEGFTADATALTIFNGILSISVIPLNFFLSLFNFEILGINLSALVSGLLTVCLTIIVIRFIKGEPLT